MLNRIIGLFGWLGVALVLSAVAVRFLDPSWQRTYNGLAVAGLVCALIYILSQWRELARAVSGRQAKFGAIALGSVLVVVAIMVAINYIASREHKRWDLTANQVYSLSPQTKKVLASLDAPVHVMVFTRSDDFQRFRDRLTEYANDAKQLSVDYIDVDQKPQLANQYKIQSYGTVIFQYKGRTERATSDGEQQLTNALIKVVEGAQKKVYFVEGHGEKDPTSSDERVGFSGAKTALEGDNFSIDKLPLAQVGQVPADATVVVIAGPQTDYLPTEIDALEHYLDRGGKLLVLLDPPSKADAPPLKNLDGLLEAWDIQPGRNVVVDASGMGRLIGTDASVPIAMSYPPHAITDNFRVLTAYPLARSMTPEPGGRDGRTAQPIIETGPRSWAEADIADLMAGKPVKMEPDKGDTPGPITIGAAVAVPAKTPPKPAEAADKDKEKPAAKDEPEPPKPESRLVAIGDSDFASNMALGIQGNRDLFLNTVNWLAQQENLIAIRPKRPDDRRLTLTAEQQTMVFWLAVIIIPGLLLMTGVQTWWRRR
jgi:ABC-type uncharacterized transport system involved in gliding motility auxiliary subunit